MTDEVDEELEEWLAEHLFGWTRQEPPMNGWWKTSQGRSVSPIDWVVYRKPWSGSAAGMYAVMETMREKGWMVDLHTTASQWCARFTAHEQGIVYDPSAPMAVAKAAKAALEKKG